MIQVKKVNNSNLGSLSSYAYSLMVISFLQSCGVIPSLQSNIEKRTLVSVFENRKRKDAEESSKRKTFDVSYKKSTNTFRLSEPEIWDAKTGVPALFYGFMKYWGYEHNYDTGKSYCSVAQGGIFIGKSIPLCTGRLNVWDPFGN